MLSRRDFIRTGAAAAGTLSFNPAFLRGAFARQAKPGPSPYGELGDPDANGLRLPRGFQSRLIARGTMPVLGTTYTMPSFPDGSAVYAQPDGGWILAVNSENPLPGQGGASALRFDKDGQVVDAYRILEGTQTNCSGGRTPWNTWLSCEEHEEGHTWDCDIFGEKAAVELPALGTFSHEAACVDPIGKRVYQTEDEGDGGFYRFTPESYPDLSKGRLEVAVVDKHGLVTWKRVPDPAAKSTPTRKQVKGMTQFKRGEGLFFEYPFAFVTTTSDAKIHAYNVITETIEVLWSGDAVEDDSAVVDVDQLTRTQGGEIFVCEDQGKFRIGILSADGRVMAPFVQLDGDEHTPTSVFGNETTGVVFDPSGTRMYFSAQRSYGFGALYEVSGPFRRETIDLREPTLRVETLERAKAARVAGRGLPVALLADEACTVKATLRTRGKRPVLIARKSVSLTTGKRARLSLKANAKAAGILRRRRSTKARLVVEALDAAGQRRKVVRDLVIPGRR
jgi:uncharacterized protein